MCGIISLVSVGYTSIRLLNVEDTVVKRTDVIMAMEGNTQRVEESISPTSVKKDVVYQIEPEAGNDTSVVYPEGYNGEYIETPDVELTDYALIEHLKDLQKKAEKLADSNSLLLEDIPKLKEQIRTTPITLDKSLEDIILMSDEDAWAYLSDGQITSYPTQSFTALQGIIMDMYRKHAVTLTVKVWYWKNPSDQTDLRKVTRDLKITVHEGVAPLFRSIFDTIYKDVSKPVINIADAGWGTYSFRAKTAGGTPAGHCYGTTIDLNPSSGSFNIGGTVYGNGYGNKLMTKELWNSLPETHGKYHVLYEDCPIVVAFKQHGFYWGGDWSVKDCMHFSYLGDISGRVKGIENYYLYN